MEQSLGKRIMQHRKALGLTQDQLAEKLGVTAQAVSKWENDQSCPDISMLPKLAGIFSITTDELLGNTTPPPTFQGEVVEEKTEAADSSDVYLKKGNWEFKYESSRKGTLMVALLVLAVGMQLLVSKLLPHEISFGKILWPTVLVCFGLSGLISHFSAVRLGFLLFGGYFLLDNWKLLPFALGGELVFPVIVVLFGLGLLLDTFKKPKKPVVKFHHKGKRKNNYTFDGETFDYALSFGDARQYVAMPVLSRGTVSTSFGDCTLDLSGVEQVSADCNLTVHCSFGDVEILVPRRYHVKMVSDTAFADVDISGHPDPEPAGIIHLTAHARFGNISITYI